MATRKGTGKTTVATNAAVKIVPKPTTRGSRPSYLRRPPQCEEIKLQAKVGTKQVIEVWAHRTEHGWRGWLEKFRHSQVLPTNWSNDMWTEVSGNTKAKGK